MVIKMIQQHMQNSMRSGISIIEVLTAIVVAMIGVFGVMVMIPFAVSQAQQGLDQEKASSLALNAVSEFEIRNYINTQRWARVDGATGDLVSIAGRPGQVYVIDPAGVAGRLNTDPAFGSGVFPFLHPTVETAITGSGSFMLTPLSGGSTTDNGSVDQNILIDRVTLSDESVLDTGVFSATASGMSRPLANHLFAWSSGLVFNEPTSSDIAGSVSYPEVEIAPPTQVMDQMADGSMGIRQSLKDMDYIVVAVPSDVSAGEDYASDSLTVGDRIISWRCYFVVYKNRPNPAPIGLTAPDFEGYDRIFEVTPPIDQVNANGAGLSVGPPADPQALSYRLSIAGGDLQMTEIVPGGAEYSSQQSEIRRGDWMMLTNVTFASSDTGQPFRDRFFQQVNFYKVVDADFDGTSWNVSLQGPDFDFFYPIDPAGAVNYLPPGAGGTGCSVEVDRTSGTYQIQPSRTFAIHLPDVWSVFERTYR